MSTELDWWSRLWPILADKGLLVVLGGLGTWLVTTRIERFKAAQARSQDFRKERDKAIGDFLEAVAELEMDGDGYVKGIEWRRAHPRLQAEHRAAVHAHEVKCLTKLERARPWIGQSLYDAGNALRGAVTLDAEDRTADGTPDRPIVIRPDRFNAVQRARAGFFRAVAGEFDTEAGRHMVMVPKKAPASGPSSGASSTSDGSHSDPNRTKEGGGGPPKSAGPPT